MNSKFYDYLKVIAQIWLPALGTLIFTLTDLWNLKWGPQAVGSITAVDAFLGVGLGLSSRSYNKNEKNFDGFLTVDTSRPNRNIYSVDVTTALETLPEMNDVRLKIRPGKLASMQTDESS
jgi:Putative phage holin Dp-1